MMDSKSPSLLLVVNDESKASRLIAALESDGYHFQKLVSLDYPLPEPPDAPPDLAILWFPYASPEALTSLEEVILQIRGFGKTGELPILLIIDQYGSHWVEPGFRLGVTDILTRPIHPLVLRQRVRLILRAKQTERAITQHELTEKVLNSERQRLFTLLDLLPVYVFLQDKDFSIIFANRTFKKLFGEPANRTCYQMLQDRVTPCVDCASVRAMQKQSRQEWEWRRPDGRIFMVYNSPFVDSDGEILGLEIGVDITERVQGEIALQQEKERFRTIADFTYDWEYWISREGVLLYNSPACERITGWRVDEFVDNPDKLLSIVHPEDQVTMKEHFQRERDSNEIFTLDYRIMTASGKEAWIGHVCQPVYNNEGKPMGRRASNRDITNRKIAEQSLIRADRLAAMGRLVASLAHEINNPLQAIYSNIELVLDFPLEEQERHQNLQIIRKEIERLMNINKSILEFSRPHIMDVKPVHVRDAIERAIFLANKQLKESNVQVLLHLPENIPQVIISADQLCQVSLNLLINAIEQMQSGGRLEITSTTIQNQVEISFSDTGPGIPPEKLDLVFDPFYTTKQNGNGLGLSTSQKIIQQYGGEISAKSNLGQGTTFSIRLPALTNQSTSAVGDPS